MAIQTINIGSSANKGDGDPLRTAFKKINENFAELDTTNTIRDIKGSVFGDDSTLLVDGVNNLIPSSVLSGSLPAIDGSALTGITATTLGGQNASYYLDYTNFTNTPTLFSGAFADLTSKPTTLSGYGISDAYTKTEVDSAISSSVLTSGSTHSIDIVAADSTLLVDSVNGTLNATTLTGALPAIDGSALTGITATTLGGQNASYYLDYNNFTNTPSLFSGAFADLTSKPSTIAGYGITDAYTKTEVDAQISAPTGDLTGSVFGDDSTLLVDGINNKIVGAVETSSLRTSEYGIALGNGAGQSSGLYSVAIGYDAGKTTQGNQSIAIGEAAGMTTQGTLAVAIGTHAGYTTQGTSSIAIGEQAGETTQGYSSVAIGDSAGQTTQGNNAVAVGRRSQLTGGGDGAVGIGYNAGYSGQGASAVAIGYDAGRTNQAANSIVLNATGSELNNTTASSLVVKPIRNASGTHQLEYNPTTGEVTYDTLGAGGGLSDVVSDTTPQLGGALDLNNNNITGNGNINITGGATVSGNLVAGTGTVGGLTFAGTQIASDDSTQISFQDNIEIAGGPVISGSSLTHTGTFTINPYALNLTTTSGNVHVQASNYVILDSTNNGQINIGLASGIGDVLIGNESNGTSVQLRGRTMFIAGMEESYNSLTGQSGVVAHDCADGHMFYHTSTAGDITANFTNLGLAVGHATNLTIVIDQGNTAHEITAVQIGGAAQTIVWQGNSAPTGTANGVDSFSFTILRLSGSYVVLGQMVAFGGV